MHEENKKNSIDTKSFFLLSQILLFVKNKKNYTPKERIKLLNTFNKELLCLQSKQSNCYLNKSIIFVIVNSKL